jgi:hypothetical protein
VRTFLLRTHAVAGLHLSEIAVRPSTEGGMVDILSTITGEAATQHAPEQAIARLAAEPGPARVEWHPIDEG